MSATASNSSNNNALSPPNKHDQVQPYACVACAQRKVKCDKHQPCAPCIKSNLECIYRAPPPPQRRKRKVVVTEQALLERVKKYEEALKSAGLPFDPFDVTTVEGSRNERDGSGTSVQGYTAERSSSTLVIRDEEEGPVVKKGMGTFVQEEGGQKFYEHSLYSHFSDEFNKAPGELAEELASRTEDASDSYPNHETTNNSLASSLVIGQGFLGWTPIHPQLTTVERLWRIFQDNIHPLTQILHPPSTNEFILEAPSRLHSLPKGKEALLYAIYASAIMSLTEDDSQRIFGESQISLLVKYQSAARHILLGSTFLKTGSLEMLQAFLLLITSMQHNCDKWSLWILLGVAIRIGQSQGLHRDGALFNLPPFEVEMRRRLWWYIVVFNTRTTEATGFSPSILPESWDTSLPLNVNDSDLDPRMSSRPAERVGATDMTFCLFRYQTAKYLTQETSLSLALGVGTFADNIKAPTEREQQERDRKITELENLLENSFLRFCDPVNPLHFLTTNMARSMLTKLRHIECYRRYLIDKSLTMSLEDQATMLELAMRNLAYDNMLHSTRSIHGFLWHVHFHFPWGAPTFTLKGLITNPDWSDKQEAGWQLIEEQHFHHPEYSEKGKPVYLVIGDLTLKAWAAREVFLMSKGLPRPMEPDCVQRLRSTRSDQSGKRNVDSKVEELPQVQMGDATCEQVADGGWDFSMYGFDGTSGMDFGGLDWNQWNAVPSEFE